MRIFQRNWLRFRNWLNRNLQTADIAGGATDLHVMEEDQVVDAFQDQRTSRHTIRVNLAILEREISELRRLSRKAQPSSALTEAKVLLDEAEKALLVDIGLFASSDKSSDELCEVLCQVFEAMRKSNRARHLLNAC